ncbi:DUF2716 domain-containing protein [Streptomyces sp. NPDC058052]|uniref:DUF2716 domain-containing protein n=1 Tax=Streptomyces sp. NPDC058052 TaxID=3346316 RepID=UPI0036E6D5C5
MDMGERWAEYDAQRGRVPSWHPVGVVVQADGPVVRRHYGTHGTAEHAPLAPGTDIAGLVRRQQEAFAARDEPVEWKVYGHDAPDLGRALIAAGFTPGWERSVLIAEELPDSPDVSPQSRNEIRSLYSVQQQAERARGIAVGSPGPHAVPYAEMIADGTSEDGDVYIDVRVQHGEVTAVGWVHTDLTRPFKIVGGLSSDDEDFVRDCTAHWRTPTPRPLLAEAGGRLRERLLEAGFVEAATVRSYHWRPAGTSETTRPAQFLDWLHDDGPLWERFHRDFDFTPSVTSLPAISAPVPSAAWHLHAHHRPVPDLPEQIDAIVQRGLLTATGPGEFVHWLDWQHDGYRYDPRRTDLPGRPPRPGKGTYPHGDYYLHLTDDLRLGTFGDPWEQTLTVWGPSVLSAVEAELTELLGEPIRRRRG